MEVVAPMARPRINTLTAAKPGFRARDRREYFRSCRNASKDSSCRAVCLRGLTSSGGWRIALGLEELKEVEEVDELEEATSWLASITRILAVRPSTTFVCKWFVLLRSVRDGAPPGIFSHEYQNKGVKEYPSLMNIKGKEIEEAKLVVEAQAVQRSLRTRRHLYVD